MILAAFSIASFILMAAIDTTYGHCILGKIAALILFVLGVSLALASLSRDENNTP